MGKGLNERQEVAFVKAMKTMRNQTFKDFRETLTNLENELIDAYREASGSEEEEQPRYEKALGRYIAFQVQNYEGEDEGHQRDLDTSLSNISTTIFWDWSNRREMEESVREPYDRLYDKIEEEIEAPEEPEEAPSAEPEVKEEPEKKSKTRLPYGVERGFVAGINEFRQNPPEDAFAELGAIYDEIWQNVGFSKARDAAFGKLLGYQHEILNTKKQYEREKKSIESGEFNRDINRLYEDFNWKDATEMMAELSDFADQLKKELVQSKVPDAEKQWGAFKKSGQSIYQFAKSTNKRVDELPQVGDEEKSEMFGTYSILHNKFESRGFFGKIFHLHEKFLCNKMEKNVLDAWGRPTMEEMKAKAAADGKKYDFGKDGATLEEKPEPSEQITAKKEAPAAEKEKVKVDFGDTFAPETAQKNTEKTSPEPEKEITVEANAPTTQK